MKKHLFLLLLVTVVIACMSLGRKQQAAPLREDPIGAVGHGAIFDQSGKEVKPDEPYIRTVQDIYISNLMSDSLPVREANVPDKNKTEAARKLIYSVVDNSLLANAIFIDYLVEQRKPRDEAQFITVNNALRWYYILKIQKNGLVPNEKSEWWKGLTPEQGRQLEAGGIGVYLVVNSNMDAYCNECLESGVPVPPNMYGPEWKKLGSFTNEFVSEYRYPELMIYISSDPDGFCLALPRYASATGDRAELLGVICFSSRTSKACFFDNPSGVFHARNVQIPFRPNFRGGTDLVNNDGGICTDCHAGENPFIVHPDKQPFSDMLAELERAAMPYNPRSWYDPLVAGEWPQNPGPTYLLDGVNSTEKCNSCHQQGQAGRFPDVSYPLHGYCKVILQNAVRDRAAGGTMPRTGDRALYRDHINALQAYCDANPPALRWNTPVLLRPTPPNGNYLSPPLIVGPVYACARRVPVRGIVLNAKATLYTAGESEPLAVIEPGRNPYQAEFVCRRDLVAGDRLYAVQERGSEVSGNSPEVLVRYYRDFYASLPTPEIDPATVYACASLIAVRHLPGATITIVTNDDEANARSVISSGNWSAVMPAGAPFRAGDRFKVKISMCGEESAYSATVTAQEAPVALMTPVFRPPNIYTGQELLDVESITNGATVTLRNAVNGWDGGFMTPISWMQGYDLATAMGRPVQADDYFTAQQKLCDALSVIIPENAKTQGCAGLPAPRIERPLAGRNFVIVADAVPGARIRVYDFSNNEVGDGSGRVIQLSRIIRTGERFFVVQQVGDCISRFVYQAIATYDYY